MVKEVKFGGTVEGKFIGGVKVGHSTGKMIYTDIEITKIMRGVVLEKSVTAVQ